MNLREVQSGDAARILEIYAPYIEGSDVSFETEVPSLENFTERVKRISQSFPYYVCEVDGVIVGYAYANKIRERPAYEYSVELSVYVDSRYQKIGVGKALYSRLLPELSKRGFYTAYAYSSKRAKRRNAPRVRVSRGGSVAQCRIQARKVA